MQPGQEPFDDGARLEVDGAEPRDDRRIEIACFTCHINPCLIGVHRWLSIGGYNPLAGTGTASSS